MPVDDGRLPLLLGEAPSARGDRYHAWPLSGPPARVLCVMAGIEPVADGSTWGRWTWALYDAFDCLNLFERHADATPWSAPAARERAAGLDWMLEQDRVVVCLGRRVHAAVCGGLDLGPPRGFYEWVSVGAAGVTAIPHPSGLNRLLNDSEERRRAGETLRRAIGHARAARP